MNEFDCRWQFDSNATYKMYHFHLTFLAYASSNGIYHITICRMHHATPSVPLTSVPLHSHFAQHRRLLMFPFLLVSDSGDGGE